MPFVDKRPSLINGGKNLGILTLLCKTSTFQSKERANWAFLCTVDRFSRRSIHFSALIRMSIIVLYYVSVLEKRRVLFSQNVDYYPGEP